MHWLEVIIGLVIYIHLCFLIALYRQDNSIMTFAWPLGILLVELISFLSIADSTIEQLIVLMITIIWAMRLFLYTFLRNIRRGYEDFRYRQVRQETASGFLIKSYIQFFIVQGIFMIIVGLPFIAISHITFQISTVQLLIGLFVFAIGFIIETVADYQLSQFKQQNDKDEVLTSGIWSISRHPNYLGEVIVWWGIGIITFVPSSIWTIISPVVVTLLLRYVSGVPMLEKRYKDIPAYQQYIKSTPPLFPTS